MDAERGNMPDPARVKLLVADTESAVADLVKAILNGMGHEIHHASHAREVRAHLANRRPDLILYENELPDWNGLIFLREIKDLGWEIPVILAGRRLDPEAVCEALHHGAFDFLPKPHTTEGLTHSLLAALRGERAMSLKQVSGFTLPRVVHIEAPSRLEFIAPLVAEISGFAVAAGFCRKKLDNNIQLALVEGITNAMEHGHGWDPGRTVSLELTVGPKILRIVVEDRGDGFAWRELPDPTDRDHLLRERGRGVFLMKSVMDTVVYNHRGNVLTLIKGE